MSEVGILCPVCSARMERGTVTRLWVEWACSRDDAVLWQLRLRKPGGEAFLSDVPGEGMSR